MLESYSPTDQIQYELLGNGIATLPTPARIPVTLDTEGLENRFSVNQTPVRTVNRVNLVNAGVAQITPLEQQSHSARYQVTTGEAVTILYEPGVLPRLAGDFE